MKLKGREAEKDKAKMNMKTTMSNSMKTKKVMNRKNTWTKRKMKMKTLVRAKTEDEDKSVNSPGLVPRACKIKAWLLELSSLKSFHMGCPRTHVDA